MQNCKYAKAKNFVAKPCILTEFSLWIDRQMLNLMVAALFLCSMYNRRYARANSSIIYVRNTILVAGKCLMTQWRQQMNIRVVQGTYVES